MCGVPLKKVLLSLLYLKTFFLHIKFLQAIVLPVLCCKSLVVLIAFAFSQVEHVFFCQKFWK